RVGLGRMTFGGEEAARAAPYGRLERRSVNGSAFEWAPVSASWPSSHLSSDCSTNPRDCPRDAGCILVDHAGVGLFGATGGKRCAATGARGTARKRVRSHEALGPDSALAPR